MSNFVKVENEVAVLYPVSLDELREKYPNVSFPEDFNGTYEDYFPVHDGLTPVIPDDSKLVEGDPFQNEAGEWIQNWVLEKLNTEELAAKMAADLEASQFKPV